MENATKKIISVSDFSLLGTIADMPELPNGAYNIRKNGESVARFESEFVSIKSKTDKNGIDVTISSAAVGETVYIPVILTETGIEETVYNDMVIEAGADVTIVAGCGIHNEGHCETRHDGVHSFSVGKGAHVKYVEKHYGSGSGDGGRIMNPVTVITLDEGATFEMESVQIEGVTSTARRTTAYLATDAKMIITEKLVTHGKQIAISDVDVYLNGEASSLQVISRSVAKEDSTQRFHPRAIGNAACRAHIQCDSIIMDKAKVASIPEIEANHAAAEIVHEAAIGRINNEQLLKLQTLGLTTEEAEKVIIDGFLS